MKTDIDDIVHMLESQLARVPEDVRDGVAVAVRWCYSMSRLEGLDAGDRELWETIAVKLADAEDHAIDHANNPRVIAAMERK